MATPEPTHSAPSLSQITAIPASMTSSVGCTSHPTNPGLSVTPFSASNQKTVTLLAKGDSTSRIMSFAGIPRHIVHKYCEKLRPKLNENVIQYLYVHKIKFNSIRRLFGWLKNYLESTAASESGGKQDAAVAILIASLTPTEYVDLWAAAREIGLNLAIEQLVKQCSTDVKDYDLASLFEVRNSAKPWRLLFLIRKVNRAIYSHLHSQRVNLRDLVLLWKDDNSSNFLARGVDTFTKNRLKAYQSGGLIAIEGYNEPPKGLEAMVLNKCEARVLQENIAVQEAKDIAKQKKQEAQRAREEAADASWQQHRALAKDGQIEYKGGRVQPTMSNGRAEAAAQRLKSLAPGQKTVTIGPQY